MLDSTRRSKYQKASWDRARALRALLPANAKTLPECRTITSGYPSHTPEQIAQIVLNKPAKAFETDPRFRETDAGFGQTKAVASLASRNGKVVITNGDYTALKAATEFLKLCDGSTDVAMKLLDLVAELRK